MGGKRRRTVPMTMSKFDPQKHHRRSIRLKNYDYAQPGGYFITIVTYQRECLFGEVINREVRLSRYGEIVQRWWHEIPVHFSHVETGAFVIMPNHIHGVILIRSDARGTVSVPRDDGINKISSGNEKSSEILGGETPPRHMPTLGQIIAYFKYQSTKEMNQLDNTGTITKFWQRNYYEHVIRNHEEWDRIHRYIEFNPSQWDEDNENPLHKK